MPLHAEDSILLGAQGGGRVHWHHGGEDVGCHRLAHSHQPEAAKELPRPGLVLQVVCISPAPLYQLLQKEQDFVWTDQCQGAFSSL